MIFDSINPANGEKVNSFEQMSGVEVQVILHKCAEAQRGWAKTPFSERARLLTAVADRLLENRQDTARLMTEEMGKVYPQGIAEVEKCALGCQYYARHAEKFLAPEDVATEAHHSFVSYKPLGAAVWTRDLARGERIAADEIQSGAAFVNDMSKSDPRMPFGGIRNSGYGRELSIFGIREFVNVHAVWVNKL